MATYHRLLQYQTLTSSLSPTLAESFDAGAYTRLEVQARILVGGGGAGTVKLQHAAVNEPDAFIDIASASWTLNTATNNYLSVTGFLRYIRWLASSGIAGSPAVVIDIIAKD